VTINTKRARLSRSHHGPKRAPLPPSWIAAIRFTAPEIVAALASVALRRAGGGERSGGS
jgi:hypothetical protein